MNYSLSSQKLVYNFSSLFSHSFFALACFLILLLPSGSSYAQTDSLILSAIENNTAITSVIRVSNETACPMNLYCYELDDGEVLLNMGVLASGRSATIRPKSELGRLYTEHPSTGEETASVYFFGGDYDLIISTGCGTEPAAAAASADNVFTSDSLVYDCLDLMANVGDACEDGILSTTDDKITDDCSCEGIRSEPITSDCDTVKVLALQDSIIVSNLNTELISAVQVFTIDWDLIFTCVNNCYETETIVAPNDSFRVYVTYYDKSWALECQVQTNISTKRNFIKDDIAISRTGAKNGGLSTIEETAKWQVYPNPASTDLVVQVAPNLTGMIRLMNLNGQLIRQVSIAALQQATWNVDVGSMERGLYILQMQTEDGALLRKKIVINR